MNLKPQNIKLLICFITLLLVSCSILYSINDTKDWTNTEYFLKIILPGLIMSGLSIFGFHIYTTSNKNQLLKTSFTEVDNSIKDPSLVSP